MSVPKTTIDTQLKQVQYFDEFFTRKEINHLPGVIREGETIRAPMEEFQAQKQRILAGQ